MKCQFTFLSLCSLLCLGSATKCRAAGAPLPIVWTASSMIRIWQDSPAGGSSQIDIYSAKNQTYSLQIGIQAPAGGLTNVKVTSSDLVGGGSAIIPSSYLSLFREHYVYVPKAPPYYWAGSHDGTNSPGGPGWYPDGLIPFDDPETGQPVAAGTLRAQPFDVPATRNQVVWVDVYVPMDAAAATYSGSFTITSDQGQASSQLKLHVWSFHLPIVPTFKSAYHCRTTNQNPYMQHELLRNRVSPDWDSPAGEPTLIQRWGLTATNLWFSTGINVHNCATEPMPSPPTVARLKAAASQHQPNLLLFNFTADEISRCPNQFSSLKAWAARLHAADIKNLVTVAPVPELEDDRLGTGQSVVDIWVELPRQMEDSSAEIKKVLAKGDTVWSYNVLVQDGYTPKNEINFSSLDYRLSMGFISQSLGWTGFQQWAVDNWTSDPWHDVTGAMQVPSDGILLYPGQQVGIIGYAPSMRLKWTRDGVNDFEYVQILKRLGRGAWALQQTQSIAPDWRTWTRDDTRLEEVRRALGDEIERAIARPAPSH